MVWQDKSHPFQEERQKLLNRVSNCRKDITLLIRAICEVVGDETFHKILHKWSELYDEK